MSNKPGPNQQCRMAGEKIELRGGGLKDGMHNSWLLKGTKEGGLEGAEIFQEHK